MNEIEVMASFGENTININSTTSYNDGTWHYACIFWKSAKQELTFNIDTISTTESVLFGDTLPAM